MSDSDLPQIYLVTPPTIELSTFPDQLAQALDAVDVGCLRLALATQDEATLSRTADACRDIAHARDVAIVIDRHLQLVERLGLDGVHLPDGGRTVGQMRKDLGGDAIIGAYCGASRHDGMNAAEAGADYVSFGPVTSSLLGDGSLAEEELFAWWSNMIEVPVVAEGGLDSQMIRTLSDKVDFISLGAEVWEDDTPIETFKALAAARA
ncbi:MAG: thiamine phosphate synthase [Pseudomonadota bacterium]